MPVSTFAIVRSEHRVRIFSEYYVLAEVAISLRVVQIKCLQSVLQISVCLAIRNHFLATDHQII